MRLYFLKNTLNKTNPIKNRIKPFKLNGKSNKYETIK